MKKGLIISSLALIGLSLFGIIESSRLERTMKMGVGIAFFPLTMSIAIGILSFILLWGIIKGKMPIKDKPLWEAGEGKRVWWVLIIFGMYVLLIEPIGYVLATFLFFVALVLFLGRGQIIKTIVTSAACTFLLYAIFRLWLKSPLPTSFLGI
ncbi:MAG: tripartite tricarboxylate transporter TctB family protein [bacterium]